MVYLAEAGEFGAWPHGGRYPFLLEGRLQVAFCRFKAWKKDSGLNATHARFTAARLHRKTRAEYPSLSCKAVASKSVAFWLSKVCCLRAQRPEATELDQLVATAAWTYAEFLRLLDTCGTMLSQSDADAIYDAGQLHLLSYSRLRSLSERTTGKALNRCLWPLLPKHHHLLHCIEDTRSQRINPNFYTLLCAESFVGLLSRIARLCNRSNVTLRVLQRYKVKLFLHCKGKQR